MTRNVLLLLFSCSGVFKICCMVDADSSFKQTRWTLVQKLRVASSEEAKEALNELCALYWRPLYAYARSYGRSQEDAEDVVQGFLTKGVEKAIFEVANQEKGKMRTFLLISFKRYLRDEYNRSIAVKRGEGKVDLVDMQDEESRLEDNNADDPALHFDRRWALIVVESARTQLRKKYSSEGKEVLHDALVGCLTGELTEGYAVIGERIGVSLAAVKVGVHRMRKRFGELLRAEVQETVGPDEDPDQELRYLIGILADI